MDATFKPETRCVSDLCYGLDGGTPEKDTALGTTQHYTAQGFLGKKNFVESLRWDGAKRKDLTNSGLFPKNSCAEPLREATACPSAQGFYCTSAVQGFYELKANPEQWCLDDVPRRCASPQDTAPHKMRHHKKCRTDKASAIHNAKWTLSERSASISTVDNPSDVPPDRQPVRRLTD